MEDEGSGRVVYRAYEGGRQCVLVDGSSGDGVGGRARIAIGGVKSCLGKGGDEETAVTPRQDRGCLRDLECVLPSGMMSFVIRCGHILCVDIHMLFFSHSVRYWC